MYFAFIVLFTITTSVFAQTKIAYDYYGLTINDNRVIMDNARWDVSTKGETTVYKYIRSPGETGVDSTGDTVNVVRRNGEIQLVNSNFKDRTYYFKDAIVVTNCGNDYIGCNVTMDVCSELRAKYERLRSCTSEAKNTNLAFPAVSNENKALIDSIPYKGQSVMKFVDSIDIKMSENASNIFSLCNDLEEYAEAPAQGKLPEKSRQSTVSQ